MHVCMCTNHELKKRKDVFCLNELTEYVKVNG